MSQAATPRGAQARSSYNSLNGPRSEYEHPSADPAGPFVARSSRSARSLSIPSDDHFSSSDESSFLLGNAADSRAYHSIISAGPDSPRLYHRHTAGTASVRRHRPLTRAGSFSARLVNALSASSNTRNQSLEISQSNIIFDARLWYDQFTSTDWVHDSIADAFRVKALRARKDFWGRVYVLFDATQGWILVAIVGSIVACLAFFVNVIEGTLFEYKSGFCRTTWYLSRTKCCHGATSCDAWDHWSQILGYDNTHSYWVDYSIFVFFVVLMASFSCLLTLQTKTVIPSAVSLSTLDENFAADAGGPKRGTDVPKQGSSPPVQYTDVHLRPPTTYYSAAGSGVAEIKVIVSGFVLHGYLGLKTLVIKTLALILSVASGLSIGKEGPYVHIATCVGNIACRLFGKYNHNDGKRREVLSASAASGVAVAFGAPIAGVLFSLEEVSYYFPPKTLFRTFFSCIFAALFLKFLNPYGTGKIVLFQVRYITDWRSFEMAVFIVLGVLGGAMGAFFIKAARFWALTFRRIRIIKNHPLLEVALIAFVTGLISWWNRYTKIPVAELLFELASPCNAFTASGTGLCPTLERIPVVIKQLGVAFVIKALLTTITFGIKVPAGIYVPSMVCGGLLGRIVGHAIQYVLIQHGDSSWFPGCSSSAAPEACVVPGVYAMVAAGATMCGVTRLSVTLAVILFELTGSLDHVLPFSIGVLVSKWTADAIEPLSIYDLLTDMNSYPFLDNKVRPIFTTELGDIVPRHLRKERFIDISEAPLVPAKQMRSQLEHLQLAGELDGGLPICKNGVLVGLIPAPDLEFALDRLENEERSLCLMSAIVGWDLPAEDQRGEEPEGDPTDFTRFIDPSPVALDVHSPMDLVYECFVKLGLRYICVLRDGKYAGLVHKKAFVKYTKDLEKSHNNS